MIRYVSLQICKEKVFPFIQENLSHAEPAPLYGNEIEGMAELQKVLTFAQSNEYYPTFFEKAAYVLISIAASQYFTNGNKRLAVSVLLQFLTANEVTISNEALSDFSVILLSEFPLCSIEDNANIREPHALFLYNLAIILGNRSVWGTHDFSVLRKKVEHIFQNVYHWLPM